MAQRKPLVQNAGRVQQLQSADDLLATRVIVSEATLSPLSVTSSVIVTNFNADLLDGLHSTDFTLNKRTAQNSTGATIVKCAPVYISAAGPLMAKAEADAEAASHVIGLLTETVLTGNTGAILTHGELTATPGEWDAVTGGIGGLVAGEIYYLSTVAGMLTTSRTFHPTWNVAIGVATSTTSLMLNIGEPERNPLMFVTNNTASALPIATPVYLVGAGVDKAKADVIGTSHVAGLVVDAAIAGSTTGTVKTFGLIEATTAQWDAVTGGTGGLSLGTVYYLSTATAGMLTTVKPTTSNVRARVGVAVGPTRMKLTLDEPVPSQAEPATIGTNSGRLSLVTGNAFGQTTDATNIFFVPFQGKSIVLFDGSRWNAHDVTEVSTAIPNTVFRLYDVFIYDNAGTLTLDTANWSQTTGAITGATNATPIVITSTAHGLVNGDMVGITGVVGNTAPNGNIWVINNVTANTFELNGSTGNGAYTSGGTWYKMNGVTNSGLATQDNLVVKAGDATRKYLGAGMTGPTAGRSSVNSNHMMLSNQYNQINHRLTINASAGHTYATAAWRPWGNDGTQTNWIVIPDLTARPISATQSLHKAASAGDVVLAGIGLNRNTDFNVAQSRSDAADNVLTAGIATYQRVTGFHLLTIVQKVDSGSGNYALMNAESIYPQ